MAIPDLLRGCPLFFELYDAEVEKLVKYCQVYSYEKLKPIVKEGEKGTQIFIVLTGSVLVQKVTPQGIIPIQSLKPGDVFGELVLVDENIRSADIIAENNCDILEINYDDIFSVFKKEPKIFGLLLLNLARLLAKRLRSSNEIIARLQQKKAA